MNKQNKLIGKLKCKGKKYMALISKNRELYNSFSDEQIATQPSIVEKARKTLDQEFKELQEAVAMNRLLYKIILRDIANQQLLTSKRHL